MKGKEVKTSFCPTSLRHLLFARNEKNRRGTKILLKNGASDAGPQVRCFPDSPHYLLRGTLKKVNRSLSFKGLPVEWCRAVSEFSILLRFFWPAFGRYELVIRTLLCSPCLLPWARVFFLLLFSIPIIL